MNALLRVLFVVASSAETGQPGASIVPKEKETTILEGEDAVQRVPAKALVPNAVFAGLKMGAFLPQPSGRFGTGFSAGVEVGYLVLSRRLGLWAEIGFNQTSGQGTGADTRVPGGTFNYDLRARDLHTAFGLLGRYEGRRVVPTVGAAFAQSFQESSVEGSSGLGRHQETASKIGGLFFAGGELALGPGSITAEIRLMLGHLDHRITGGSYTRRLGLLAGYRMMF